MQFQLKTAPKLSPKLKLTPQMRLSTKLLQLSLIKLKEFISKQIDENPLLDIKDEGMFFKAKNGLDEDYRKKQDYRETLIISPPTLKEHLSKQLHISTKAGGGLKIGKLIIGNIDDNGYLRASLKEIAKAAKASRSQVREVLSLIQNFDPLGVGARNLKECLLIQLKTKNKRCSCGHSYS
ncbi:MAG: hypothetical protein NG712_03815, partial [Omnitrophica bacterium]|nr:hypothetical protein [Candidatus Omnitrophota bacterium]